MSRLSLVQFIGLAMCSALACAAPTPPKITPAPIRVRTDRGDLGLVAIVEGTPTAPFVPPLIYPPGRQLLLSTVRGAAYGVYACILPSVGEPVLAAFLLVYCAPVLAPAGAVIGALTSKPKERQDNFEQASQSAVTSAQEQLSLGGAATRYAERSGWLLVDAPTADTVVELNVELIELLSEDRETAFLSVRYTAGLVRLADGAILAQIASTATSRTRPIDEWMNGEAQRLQESLAELLGEISENAVDDFILVYAGEREMVVPPAPRLLAPSDPSLADQEPALRWEAWPWGPEAPPESADSVVYDLRIRELGERILGNLHEPHGTLPIYERFGLRKPAHVLRRQLPMCGYFEVQVRARFSLGEATKATEWISFENALDTVERFEDCALPWWYSRS